MLFYVLIIFFSCLQNYADQNSNSKARIYILKLWANKNTDKGLLESRNILRSSKNHYDGQQWFFCKEL